MNKLELQKDILKYIIKNNKCNGFIIKNGICKMTCQDCPLHKNADYGFECKNNIAFDNSKEVVKDAKECLKKLEMIK